MPLLTRKKVLTIDRNRITVLPTTLDSAGQAENIVIDASASVDVERIDRNFALSTLSAVKDLAGQKAAEFTFGIEMKGSNNGTAEPEWSRILDGCGFRGEAIETFTITTPLSSTDTFRHGELITFTGGNETATVVMDTHAGSDEIFFFDRSATISAPGVITGQDSGATATVTGTEASAGYAWWPISSVVKKILFDATGLTTALSAGDLIGGTTSGARGIVTEDTATSINTIVKYSPVRGTFTIGETMELISGTPDTDIGDLNGTATGEQFDQFPAMGIKLFTDGKAITGNGCRGNVSFNFEVNRPVRMDFTFRGQLENTTDTPLLTGIDYENTDPPLWETSSIGFARNETAAEAQLADEVEPCMTTLSVDMGNQSADRKCAGATDGLLEVLTSQRDGSGSMTVEDTLESDLGWLTRVQDNESVRLRLTVGGTAGNRFTFAMPGVQFTGASEGDSDGIVTQDMAFRLTGGNLHDLTGNTRLSATGGDNELVIIYHTS
jgi:hypothetical protein